MLHIISARCNIYISRLCYDVSVRLSACDGSALAHYFYNTNRLAVSPVKLKTVGSRPSAVAAAPHVWNSLPTGVVAANSLSTIRRLLKCFFYSGNHIVTLFTDIIYQWPLQWLCHSGHFKNWLTDYWNGLLSLSAESSTTASGRTSIGVGWTCCSEAEIGLTDYLQGGPAKVKSTYIIRGNIRMHR